MADDLSPELKKLLKHVEGMAQVIEVAAQKLLELCEKVRQEQAAKAPTED